MSDFELRPRFRLEVKNPESEVKDIIRNKLKYDNAHHFHSTLIEGHLVLRIDKKDRHFWSPQMDVSLQPLEDGGTLIRCLLAPEPAVWTMFMFLYTATGFGAFIGLMLAMSQWTLERYMWGFWLSLGCIALGLLTYVVAQTGKKISSDDMKIMRNFITDISWK